MKKIIWLQPIGKNDKPTSRQHAFDGNDSLCKRAKIADNPSHLANIPASDLGQKFNKNMACGVCCGVLENLKEKEL